jgi:putative ATP-binding cassette transporter
MKMKMKRLSEVFWTTSPNLFFFSIILSVVVGLSYSLLIPFILYSVDSDYSVYLKDVSQEYDFTSSPISGLAFIYFVAIFSIVFFKTLSMIFSSIIGSKATVKNRVEMCRKINALPISTLERLGQAKLINLLNYDIPRVTAAALNLPTIWVSSITILGVLGYLLYINLSVFIFVVASLVVAIITYQIPLALGSMFLDKQRSQVDIMQSGCRGLILGAKELKLDSHKFEAYLEQEISNPENAGRKHYIKGISLIHLGENYGDILSMIVVGVVVFHLPYIYAINQTEIFATVMALLYLTGPVSMILGSMGAVEMGNVSLRKINDFYLAADDDLSNSGVDLQPWDTLELSNVSFHYPGKENSFSLRSIYLTLKKGQITFIVGGNGSGKSTLSKVLSTHYSLSVGDISFGNQSISSLNKNSVRNAISAIYTDFYLFPRLYHAFDADKANKILEKLELDQKVSISDGQFSTTELSDGQRKRLALLSLLLEDRPICIFDEWAADQDPRFKEFFYYTILPELRAQNKLIIVISHDDRYFSVADQVVVMEEGSIREVLVHNTMGQEFKSIASG